MIDTTTGSILGGSGTIVACGHDYALDGASIDLLDGFSYLLLRNSQNVSTSAAFWLPAASLVGYTGGPLCSIAVSCYGSQSTHYIGGVFVNGTYAGEAAAGALTLTPEPSSLALLATSAVGMLGAMRQRLRG